MNNEPEIIYYNEDGTSYILDENGNHRPPMQATKNSKPNTFTTYNTDQGHCGLCGRLDCRGNCFK